MVPFDMIAAGVSPTAHAHGGDHAGAVPAELDDRDQVRATAVAIPLGLDALGSLPSATAATAFSRSIWRW
jgi:hypothetical protein